MAENESSPSPGRVVDTGLKKAMKNPVSTAIHQWDFGEIAFGQSHRMFLESRSHFVGHAK
jgi:hypothetical protein